MKFSYKLIKKYLPELESKEQLIEALTMHAFEAEDAGGGAFNVEVPTNRYSDAASHIGVAREAAVIFGLDSSAIPMPDMKKAKRAETEKAGPISISVQDEGLCPRYTAEYFEGVEVGPSPDWMQEILKDCGLRPINNVVDIMNFVMLETGQPLHAFDFDKIKSVQSRNSKSETQNEERKEIIVRRAKDGEEIETIDEGNYKLNKENLLIADKETPLAIAGVKGGASSAVSDDTESIVVESANFDGVSVYKTAREVGLDTDASFRFSHGIHPELALVGLERAKELLQEIVGAEPAGRADSNLEKPARRSAPFSVEEFNAFIGSDFEAGRVVSVLESLGFVVEENKVRIPTLRDDVQTREDVFEEVIRILGLDDLPPKAPNIGLTAPDMDEKLNLIERLRDILAGLGYDEVYNYSFVAEGGNTSIEVDNPISQEKRFLRRTLMTRLSDNLEENLKFFKRVRIFEVGRIFSADNGASERDSLAVGFGLRGGTTLYEVKGVVEELLNQLGVAEVHMVELQDPHGLEIHAGDTSLGLIWHHSESTTLAEINIEKLLNLVREEQIFSPIPEYPAVERDMSVLLPNGVKVGPVLQEIQMVNQELIRDVDLIDEYVDEEGESLTFRIVFRANDRTLRSEEVDELMEEVQSVLGDEFGVEAR